MQKHELTLSFEGLVEENGHIRAAEFASELQSFIRLLKETDNQVTGFRKSSFYLRIVGLSHNSPATVTLEAIPTEFSQDGFNPTINRFVDIFEDIENQKDMGLVDYRLLEALQKFVSPVGKSMESLSIAMEDRVINVTSELGAKVNLAIAPEETFPGELRGMLEYINVHENTRTFRIYPDIGPNRVTCLFPDELTDHAIKAIRSFVEVRGILRQKKVADFPNEIEVEEIEIFPSEDKLPTLTDIRGMAPDATGEMNSVDFIRSIRNEF